jgi:hypothetical protein
MYINCLLASLKTLTNYRNFETHCYYGFLLVNFVKCTFMAGFSKNNFQDHRQLSEQLLESQEVGTSFLMRVKSVTGYIEASRIFFLFSQKDR